MGKADANEHGEEWAREYSVLGNEVTSGSVIFLPNRYHFSYIKRKNFAFEEINFKGWRSL